MGKKLKIEDDPTVQAAAKRLSDAKWRQFLELTIAGVPRAIALRRIDVGTHTMQAFLVTNAAHREIYEEARLAHLRSLVPIETFEEVCDDIALGKTAKIACHDLAVDLKTFYSLTLRDPSCREMYDEARQIAAEGMLDDIIDISDDTTRDLTGQNKPNHEVMHRSALRVKARQWAMSKTNYERFGDRQQQDVEINANVNHVDELDAARRRKEAVHAARAKGIAQRALTKAQGQIAEPVSQVTQEPTPMEPGE